jgi:D-3-phosphoglycerate dehydrogenase
MKVLITCPPMIKRIEQYDQLLKDNNISYFCPEFIQVLTEDELIELLPNYDGWIIGDDPATSKVFEAGIKGNLKAAVKWGVGTDNVDFEACKRLGIPITNIPNVFGEEVSDVGMGMLLNITRQLHKIDYETKQGNWIKPSGMSLSGKKVCLIGFGDIGRSMARKLLAFNLHVYVSDPGFEKINETIVCKYNEEIVVKDELNKVHIVMLNKALDNADFICITCSLNKATHHLINKDTIIKAKQGVIIINVARGPVVCEKDVIDLLEDKHVGAVGFDVFETEPLPLDSKLRLYPQNFYGSHNGSNTIEGVDKTSYIAIKKIIDYLNYK